jgi:alkyl sulfatase BDS1-like metallo-beta-lactamase superfamily hydrolase
VATVEDCEQALHALAERLSSADAAARGRVGFDRTLSCLLSEPDVNFAGRLRTGSLTDIRQVSAAEATTAKVRLHMRGDDLIKLVAGELKMASAWASGQVKIEASVLDLVKLRSIL